MPNGRVVHSSAYDAFGLVSECVLSLNDGPTLREQYMSARTADEADMLALLRCRSARVLSHSCCRFGAFRLDTSAAALHDADAACAGQHVIHLSLTTFGGRCLWSQVLLH